jgi:hypothetical protein
MIVQKIERDAGSVKVGVGAPRRCMEDEGRPLGAGLQELASNHLKLQW